MAQNYVLLERIELNASAASVTFSNIPQTGYTDLKVVISAINTVGLSSTILKFNGSSSGYTYKALRGSGTAAASFNQATWGNGAYIQTGYNINGSTPNSNELYIPNYAGSSNKSVSIDSVQEANTTTAYSFLVGALWANSAAITTIELSCDTGAFASGSTFSIYGIAKLGTTPAIAPKATGGNVIATDGTYWYHAFLSNGTFTPSLALNADVLVVAGGGAGGLAAGGGGAGGVLAFATQSLANGTGYTCAVGAGGAGFTSYQNPISGTNSQFASLTASIGGGGGGGYNGSAYVSGANGGSGGGSGWGLSNTYGTGTSGQGYNGGLGAQDASGGVARNGGGGGGAGGVGGNGSIGTPPPGGSGVNTVTNWGSLSAVFTATGLGVSGYLAGGGGGSPNTGAGGAGGSGGGGAGGGTAGTAGVANTGSGGGGSSASSGSGGSGIIIVRYTVA